ncbi:hypothetical protein HFTV1-gp49 [Haloferax tailed virus 1]|uniref:Uncharacterized protein n=1 Tax=Haloferax tailed virus 1 TaxID=2507575 RepID=A0A410N6X1_HFTV1|nr:hypothetical protein M1M17_gp49 [Haloferax tailed virus 1]QAS68882.1 hypothetical protein HFTV1-gp49 [Haloferax tailed virus 1]
MSEPKYAMYVGDYETTVSVWLRKNGEEYPIYANTRGQCEWYTHNVSDCENTTEQALSDGLKAWLAEFHRRINSVDDVTPNHAMPDVEWYEVEFLNAIGEPEITDEVMDLLEWAYNEEQQ